MCNGLELTVKMKMGEDLAVYPEDRDIACGLFCNQQ